MRSSRTTQDPWTGYVSVDDTRLAVTGARPRPGRRWLYPYDWVDATAEKQRFAVASRASMDGPPALAASRRHVGWLGSAWSWSERSVVVGEGLAELLRQLRDVAGRSLRELAREVHISSSSLSRYFSGQSVPPWSAVVALCRVAGRDPRLVRPAWERAKDGARENAGAGAAAGTVRNDLPHDVTGFTGRRAELDELLAAARQAAVVAIDGMGGVGKTALAVHAAHLVGDAFPGDRLYVDLHGFTPGREPVEPAEALRVLLTALGVAPSRIPEGTVERAALWRSELATRRAIIVLDNAADAEQVRQLLPGAGHSFAMVTSRRRMVGLDGAVPISLEVLPSEEAAELFTAAAGGSRPGDIGEVLRRCGNLPLAIRVAAARLRHRPSWTLETLVERLDDGEVAASDVFAMSLRQLDAAQRRMFALLGLVPGEDIDAYGAAALAEIPLANARALLEDLVDVHLLQEPAPGRYRMHDLVRQAARADAGPDGQAIDLASAITRLGDYYLSGLVAVKEPLDVLVPLPVVINRPPTALPDLSAYEAAVAWLDAEWVNVNAIFSLAVKLRIDALAVGLAQLATISRLRRGGVVELCHRLELSMPAARRLGARGMLAAHHYLLGSMLMGAGRLEKAEPNLKAARPLMAAEGDIAGESMSLLELARIRMFLADGEAAVELLRQAETVLTPNETALRVRVRADLGEALVLSRRYDEAVEVVSEVLGAARGLDPQTERMCLETLGRAELGRGDTATALDFAEQSLTINRTTRHPVFEAHGLSGTAVVLLHLGRVAEATARQAEAVRILERVGEPHALARNHLRYADACVATDDPETAARHFQAALEIATAGGIDYLIPVANSGLERVSRPVPPRLGHDRPEQ